MLQVEALLFGVVVGQDVLTLAVGMISTSIFVLVLEYRRCDGTRAGGFCVGAIGRVCIVGTAAVGLRVAI